MNWKMLPVAMASVALVLMPALAMADGSKVEKGDITHTGTGSALIVAQTDTNAPTDTNAQTGTAEDEEDEGIAAGAIVAGAGLLAAGLGLLAVGLGGGGGGGATTGTTATQ